MNAWQFIEYRKKYDENCGDMFQNTAQSQALKKDTVPKLFIFSFFLLTLVSLSASMRLFGLRLEFK